MNIMITINTCISLSEHYKKSLYSIEKHPVE
jgi:hypothetical protein